MLDMANAGVNAYTPLSLNNSAIPGITTITTSSGVYAHGADSTSNGIVSSTSGTIRTRNGTNSNNVGSFSKVWYAQKHKL